MPKTRFSKKFFPFAPGIPWVVKNNKYIVPQINSNIWNRVFDGKDFIISCYGGFLESFFSLSYCEAIAKIEPNRNLLWMGDPDMELLISMHGLAKVNPFDLGSDIVDKYPTPIFMDKEDHVYFNVLNNYIETKSYKPGRQTITNTDIILKQLFKNSLIPWDNAKPIIRSSYVGKLKKWTKDNNIHENAKFILIFPHTWKSMHDIDALGWSDREIRELAAMLRHLNIYVVCCENTRYDAFYHAGHVFRAPIDLELIIQLIIKSSAVLSADVDFPLISMALSSKTIIISKDVPEIYDFYNHADYLGAENVIFTDNGLNPKTVFQYLESMKNTGNL